MNSKVKQIPYTRFLIIIIIIIIIIIKIRAKLKTALLNTRRSRFIDAGKPFAKAGADPGFCNGGG